MNEYAAPNKPPAPQSAGVRAAELYKEAEALANTYVVEFLATLERAVVQASEISEGGDIYATGVRDICKKLAEQLTYRVQAVNSIMRHDSRGGVEAHFGSLDENDLAHEMTSTAPARPVPSQVEAELVDQSTSAPEERPGGALPLPIDPSVAPDRGRIRIPLAPAAVIAEQLAAIGRRDTMRRAPPGASFWDRIG